MLSGHLTIAPKIFAHIIVPLISSHPFVCLTVLYFCVWNGICDTYALSNHFGVVYFLAISSYQEVDLFSEIRSTDFNSVFGSSQAPTASTSTPSSAAGVGVSLNQYTMGDILTPQAVGPHAQQPVTIASAAPKALTSDVDSSLAAAAANLSMFPTSTPSATAASSSGFFATSTPERLWAGKPVWKKKGKKIFLPQKKKKKKASEHCS